VSNGILSKFGAAQTEKAVDAPQDSSFQTVPEKTETREVWNPSWRNLFEIKYKSFAGSISRKVYIAEDLERAIALARVWCTRKGYLFIRVQPVVEDLREDIES